MATTKYTIQRGKSQIKDIPVTGGAAEAQTDTLSVNVDFTKFRRGEVILALEYIIQKIQLGKDIPA